jgi:glycerol-3-phosphate O-acyltransferase
VTALRDLTGSGLVTGYTGGTEPVYSIGDGKHLEAAFYRNTLVHFFVTRAIVELALVAVARSEHAHGAGADLEELTWAEALRLRDLLKFEFFFPSKRVFAEQVRDEARLIAHDWERRERTPEEILRVLGRARPLFAPLVLLPFLEAYGVAADRLSAWPVHEAVRERDLLAECGRVARQRVLQLELRSPEANSRELFRGGLQLAGNRGLLLPAAAGAAGTAGTAAVGDTPADLQQRRADFAAELAADVRRCRAVADLPAAPLRR